MHLYGTVDKFRSNISEVTKTLKITKSELHLFNLKGNAQKNLKPLLHVNVKDDFGRFNEKLIEDIDEDVSFELLCSAENVKDRLIFLLI